MSHTEGGHRACVSESRHHEDVESEVGALFGPGEAKLELKERRSRSTTFSECTVDIETADKLTDPQIVARVKEQFRIDR